MADIYSVPCSVGRSDPERKNHQKQQKENREDRDVKEHNLGRWLDAGDWKSEEIQFQWADDMGEGNDGNEEEDDDAGDWKSDEKQFQWANGTGEGNAGNEDDDDDDEEKEGREYARKEWEEESEEEDEEMGYGNRWNDKNQSYDPWGENSDYMHGNWDADSCDPKNEVFDWDEIHGNKSGATVLANECG